MSHKPNKKKNYQKALPHRKITKPQTRNVMYLLLRRRKIE